jgi:hypothetical protein
MRRDQAIASLESMGGTCGKTARGGRDYDRAEGLVFRPCYTPSWYRCTEYVADGRRGGHVYIGLNHLTERITLGPKGFPFRHG